ncbi:hypothetical protein BH23ACT10_BH23ACT10_05290 [soil metagenome]
MDLASERGMARLTTTARVAVFVLVVSVIAFDLGAIVVNVYQLDELSQRAAQSGAAAYRRMPTAAMVEAAVHNEVAADGTVRIDRIALDQTAVWVTLRRPPSVLVLDKVSAIRQRIDVAITQQAALQPRGL